MLFEQLLDLFLGAGVRQISDEESTRLWNIFLLLVLLQLPGEVSVNFFGLSVSLTLTARGIHTEDLNITPTWKNTGRGEVMMCQRTRPHSRGHNRLKDFDFSYLCSLYSSSWPFLPVLQCADPHIHNLKHTQKTPVMIHGQQTPGNKKLSLSGHRWGETNVNARCNTVIFGSAWPHLEGVWLSLSRLTQYTQATIHPPGIQFNTLCF